MVRKNNEILGDSTSILADDVFPLYLIRSEKNVLVDASITARARKIEAQLDAELKSEPLHHVLLTHSHYDHTGALSYLQTRHHFSIICSRRTKEILENPKAIDFINRLNQEFKILENDLSDICFTMPGNIHAVGEGDILPLSNSSWLDVYETPGHTRCSISFLLQPQRILFVGDAAGVMERDARIKPLFLSSYKQYENSLLKISGIKPEVLAMPHNVPIRGADRVANFLERSLAETRRAKEEIIAELNKGKDVSRIAEEFLAREYPRPVVMGPREAFLINLTAMVKTVYNEFIAPAAGPGTE
jgi:2-aminobenzoylacetyl-CoA thioesterase